MRSTEMSLQGKVAFITGAAGGIGEGCALSLARFGANIVIADIDNENAERVAASIRELGCEALFVKTDVIHVEQIEAAVARAVEHFGRIDILVNNAGGVRKQAFLEQSERSWRKHIDFNLISMLAATQSVTKVMIKGERGGTIINIASSEGLRAAPGFAVYAACKAGMISFTRSMALELADHGIHVHALAPDMIETPGLKPYFEAAGETQNAARDRYIPLKRLGSITEVGNVAAFLACGMASYLTGLTLPVDGGALASSGWSRSPSDGTWNLYHG